MLSIRDQENRLHSQQTIAAAKSSATGSSQHAASKTPRLQAPKTPFKVPLNDENDRKGLLGGKSIFKTAMKGNENVLLASKQSLTVGKAPLKTPSGPRAPLAQKTANPKAKGQQLLVPSPALAAAQDHNTLARARQHSASARRKGPRMSHVEPVRIDVLSDQHPESDFDIGVIHPRPADLPDTPDDLPDIDLSSLNGDFVGTNLLIINNLPGADGLSYIQRKQKQRADDLRKADAYDEAFMKRSIELCASQPCIHDPICEDECIDEPARRERVEKEYQRAVERIFAIPKTIESAAKSSTSAKTDNIKSRPLPPSQSRPLVPKSTILPPKSTYKSTRPDPNTNGLSSSLSKAAADKLSMRPTTAQTEATRNRIAARQNATRPSTFTANRLASQLTGAAHSNTRHGVAVHASRTTMGYAQSRKLAGEKRGSVLPKSSSEIFQPLCSTPTVQISIEDRELQRQAEESVRLIMLEDALDDFQLEMPE